MGSDLPLWMQLPFVPKKPEGLVDLTGRSWEVARHGTKSIVRPVRPEDMKRAVDIVVNEMAKSSLGVHCVPDDNLRHSYKMQLFGDSFGRQPGTWGYAHEVDGFKAVCFWTRSDMPLVYSSATTTEKQAQVTAEQIQLEGAVMAGAPIFYYLVSLVSVDRRKGYARAVLEPMLRLADEEDLPCYLDDTTGIPAIRTFYESLGFVVCGQLCPDGFPVQGMYREPASRRLQLWREIPFTPTRSQLGDLSSARWEVDRRGSRSVVRPVAPSDLQRVIDVCVAAFVPHEIMRWSSGSPHSRDRIQYMLRLCDPLVRQPAYGGWVHEIDGFKAVSAWCPSDIPLKFSSVSTNESDQLERVFTEMEERIMADVPHFLHLNLLASAEYGGGYARALVEPMLQYADERGMHCYLEDTTNTAFLQSFYESLGFISMETYQLGPVNVHFRRRNPKKL